MEEAGPGYKLTLPLLQPRLKANSPKVKQKKKQFQIPIKRKNQMMGVKKNF